MRIKHRAIHIILTAFLAGCMTGCADGAESVDSMNMEVLEESSISEETALSSEKDFSTSGEEAFLSEKNSSTSEETVSEADKSVIENMSKEEMTGEDTDKDNQETIAEILDFVDVFGEHYQVEINPEVKKHDYRLEAFKHQGDLIRYDDNISYKYRLGIDVSHHQGKVNWEKVKEGGFDFAFIRIGYRGYGTGSVNLDREFDNNIKAAKEAGLDIGVYFFSQAINEEEAEEEAEFVLKALDGCELQLPVVYDPESILDDKARTDDVTGEQFTKNTICFCEKIKEAGYEPMIYSNMLWEAYEFDLAKLSDYEIWYADYELLPQTPYHFAFWQYYNEGKVDGVNTPVDMNIQLMPVGDEEK